MELVGTMGALRRSGIRGTFIVIMIRVIVSIISIIVRIIHPLLLPNRLGPGAVGESHVRETGRLSKDIYTPSTL